MLNKTYTGEERIERIKLRIQRLQEEIENEQNNLKLLENKG